MNGIANPHDFYDALKGLNFDAFKPDVIDATLADMATTGKWFGSLDSMALDGDNYFGKNFGQ